MKLQNYRQVDGTEAAPGVIMHVVAGPVEGAPTFVMRVFEIQPGSATPTHTHDWEHEIFVISGRGTLRSDEDKPIEEGDAIMVLTNELHGFDNTGIELLRIICVVPLVDGKMPGMIAAD